MQAQPVRTPVTGNQTNKQLHSRRIYYVLFSFIIFHKTSATCVPFACIIPL